MSGIAESAARARTDHYEQMRTARGDVTDQEIEVLNKLAEAWNLFIALPEEHASEREEFASEREEFAFFMHACQGKVLSRAARRQIVVRTQTTQSER